MTLELTVRERDCLRVALEMLLRVDSQKAAIIRLMRKLDELNHA